MKANRGFVKFAALSLAGASVFAVACSDNTPPPPRAGVTTQLGPGPSAPFADCQLATQSVIEMGSPENGQSVENGSYNNVNTVDCSVIAAGATYTVTARLAVKSKGSVFLNGVFQPIDKTKPGPQQANVGPLTVSWVIADTGTFRESDCTAWYTNDLTFPTTSTVLQSNMGVATGRVWATVYCPTASFVGDQTVHKACQAVGEFKLENCGTQ